MTTNQAPYPTEEEVSALQETVNRLIEINGNLPTATRADTEHRVHEMEVMRDALLRDLQEAKTPGGANRETVSRLYAELKHKADSLLDEMDALATGNPTTVSAAGDATMNAMQRIAKSIAKQTDKVFHPKD